MSLLTIRTLLRFFFSSVGLVTMQQEDGSVLVTDRHGVSWRVTVERMT